MISFINFSLLRDCRALSITTYSSHISFERSTDVFTTRGKKEATKLTLHTVSVVVVQAVLTPIWPHVDSPSAQVVHGVLPEVENVLPASHGTTLHAVSVVAVQAVLTPAAHVEASAQVVHGVLPEVENVLPASHGTLHAVSVVVLQAVFTPAAHVEVSAHGEHGA